MADDKRGTYGDGTIRDRKDGRIEKRLRLGIDPRTGKYIRKSVYGRNLRDLQANARKAIIRFKEETRAIQAKGSLEEYVLGPDGGAPGWLDLKAREIGPRTLHNYRTDFERYIAPHLGYSRLNPETMTVYAITRWHAELTRKHGAYTANRARNLLANILGDTPSLRLNNPAKVVRAARHQKAPIEIFTANELEVFIPAAERTRLRNMFLLSLTTGLRHGEAAALHWADVTLYRKRRPDADHGELHVRRAVVRTNAGTVIAPTPKTHASRRSIGLSPEAAAALEHQRSLLEAEGLADSPLVFPTTTGRLQPVENTNRTLRGVIDACNPQLMEVVLERRTELRSLGLSMLAARSQAWQDVQALPHFTTLLVVKYLSFHALRHTFASIMIKAGMDAPRLALILGHSDPAFTMRTYVHFFEARKREAMPRVSMFVPGFNHIGGQIGGQTASEDPENE